MTQPIQSPRPGSSITPFYSSPLSGRTERSSGGICASQRNTTTVSQPLSFILGIESSVSDIQRQMGVLTSEMQRLETQLSDLNRTQEEANEEFSSIQENITKTNASLQSLTDSKRSLNETLIKNAASLQDTLARSNEQFNKTVRSLQEGIRGVGEGLRQVRSENATHFEGTNKEVNDAKKEAIGALTEIKEGIEHSSQAAIRDQEQLRQAIQNERDAVVQGLVGVRASIDGLTEQIKVLALQRLPIQDRSVASSSSNAEQASREASRRDKEEECSSGAESKDSCEFSVAGTILDAEKGVILSLRHIPSLPVTCNGCVASHRYGEEGKFSRAYTMTEEQKGRAQEILTGFKRYVQDLEEASLEKFNISLAEEKVSWEQGGQRVYKKFSDLVREEGLKYRFMGSERGVARWIEETEQFFTEISGFPSRPVYHRSEEDGRLSTRSYGPSLKSILPTSVEQRDYVAAMSLYQKLESDPAKRTQALQRVGQAELVIEQLRGRVIENLHHLASCLSQHPQMGPLTENQTEQIHQYRRLLKVKQKLESIDTFALYLAVAYADSLNAAEAAIRAEKLRKEVSEYLLQQMQTPYLSKEAQDYATDVGGLVFYGLTDEAIADREYGKYCQRHHMRESAKGLSEAIVRGMVNEDNNPVLERLMDEIEPSRVSNTMFLKTLEQGCIAIDGVVGVPNAPESFTQRTLNAGRKLLRKPQTSYALESQVAQMRTAGRLYVPPRPLPPSRPVQAYSPSIDSSASSSHSSDPAVV